MSMSTTVRTANYHLGTITKNAKAIEAITDECGMTAAQRKEVHDLLLGMRVAATLVGRELK